MDEIKTLAEVDGYYEVAVRNREEVQTLYVLVSDAGDAVDVNITAPSLQRSEVAGGEGLRWGRTDGAVCVRSRQHRSVMHRQTRSRIARSRQHMRYAAALLHVFPCFLDSRAAVPRS